MHQLLFALLVWQSADSPVVVRTKDGQSLQGKLSQDSVRLRTSFGEAIFERASIHSIEFGDPDVVTTTEKLKLHPQPTLMPVDHRALVVRPAAVPPGVRVMIFSPIMDQTTISEAGPGAGGGTRCCNSAIPKTAAPTHSVTARAPHFVLLFQNRAAARRGERAAYPEKAYCTASSKIEIDAWRAMT